MRAGTSRGTERSFGLSLGGVCGLFTAYAGWRGHVTASWVFGGLALVLIVPALVRPALLRVPQALWWRVAHAVGWFNSRVLLTLFFLLVLTPVGVILRWLRWDPLRLTRARSASGWVPYPERLRNPRHYERMY